MFNYELFETEITLGIKVKGWTMDEFARKIDMTKTGYYSALKNRSWKVERFIKICEVINLDPVKFLTVVKARQVTPETLAAEMETLAKSLRKMNQDNG